MSRALPSPLAIVLALGAAACSRGSAAERSRPVASAAPSAGPVAAAVVRFAKAESRRLPRSFETTGSLEADLRSEVASQAAAVVTSVLVDVGGRVKKGDVLVELDGRDASLRLQSAEATVAQQLARLGIRSGETFDVTKVADVRVAKEARTLALSEAERAKTLFRSGGITQAALDAATSAAERSDAQLDAAKSGAEQAFAALTAARVQSSLARKAVDDTRVRAPFDGAVVERRVAPGEFAQVGRVVVVLMRDDPLRLRLDVPETSVSLVALGRSVDLSVAAHPGRTFHAEIKRIGASVRPDSRSLPVEAEVPNPDGALRPGFFARAIVSVDAEPVDAVVVPAAAIGTSGGSARVFVRSADRVLERLVTVGRPLGDRVEVRGAVAAGDEVAVSDVDKLGDAAPVAVAP